MSPQTIAPMPSRLTRRSVRPSPIDVAASLPGSVILRSPDDRDVERAGPDRSPRAERLDTLPSRFSSPAVRRAPIEAAPMLCAVEFEDRVVILHAVTID